MKRLLIVLGIFMVMVLGSHHCIISRTQSVHDTGVYWHVTNETSWIINVRDPETLDQKPIYPEQSATLDRGSSGTLEVNSTHDQFVFHTDYSIVSITEPFKGQLTLREDEKVCPCNAERAIHGCAGDCD